jgi:cytochrome b561
VTARGTDWGLAALVASLIATGVLTLFEGSSHDAWVFAAHDALGVAIAVLVVVKLRRVWPRIRSLERWDGRTAAGVSVAALVVATLVSGWVWSTGADATIAGYSLLGWHDALGAVLALLVVAHMVLRAKPVRSRDVVHRRQFLAAAGIGVGSLVAWRVQRPLLALVELRGPAGGSPAPMRLDRLPATLSRPRRGSPTGPGRSRARATACASPGWSPDSSSLRWPTCLRATSSSPRWTAPAGSIRPSAGAGTCSRASSTRRRPTLTGHAT